MINYFFRSQWQNSRLVEQPNTLNPALQPVISPATGPARRSKNAAHGQAAGKVLHELQASEHATVRALGAAPFAMKRGGAGIAEFV
ncbi:MAG: hypothetical protein OXI60_01270 [Acidiferrobacterales bacterium]|nr:hypothetical protein [Acidiferrobacterales bacterium]